MRKTLIILIFFIINPVFGTEYNSYINELNLTKNDLKSEIKQRPLFIGMDLCGTLINSKASDLRAINKTIKTF